MSVTRDLNVKHADSNAADSPATLVNTAVVDGNETRLVQVECRFTRGFAGLQLIGNMTDVCRDGKERARVALEQLGIQIPPQRLVLSLTPADVKMDGNQFDLPLAVTLALLLQRQPPGIRTGRWLFAAELGLGGELRPVRGAVAFALAASAAGLDGLVVAAANLQELGVLGALTPSGSPSLQVFAFTRLAEVLAWLFQPTVASPLRCQPATLPPAAVAPVLPNFDDMLLQPKLELAALTAAAGLHNLLLRGPPGTGKSMLAARMPSILPLLAPSVHIEAMRIYSTFADHLPASLLAGRPPYRAPHHQASAAAVMGSSEAPGELALAHGGVLFLDELPEFRRDLLEALREPLETSHVRISRSKRKVIWPAAVMLVAACNNCPCGWYGSARRDCLCGVRRLINYRQRLSGPILERIDLHVNVPEYDGPTAGLITDLGPATTSQTKLLSSRVAAARALAAERNAAFGVACNRDLQAAHLVAASGLSRSAFADLVAAAVPRFAGARCVLRCLRVARTLADLSLAERVTADDVRQAWSWQSEQAARERGEEMPGSC